MRSLITLSTSAHHSDVMSPASRLLVPTSRELGEVWLQAALGFCASTMLMIVILAAVVS